MCFLSSQCLSRYIFSRNTVQTAFLAFLIRPPARSAGASYLFPVQPQAAAGSRPAPDMTVSASGIIVTYIQTNCQRYFGLLNKKTAYPCMIMPSDNISALFAPLSLRSLPLPGTGYCRNPRFSRFGTKKSLPAPRPPLTTRGKYAIMITVKGSSLRVPHASAPSTQRKARCRAADMP